MNECKSLCFRLLCQLLASEHPKRTGSSEPSLSCTNCVSAGCPGEWNNVSCWPNAAVGEVLTLPCPSPFLLFFEKKGNLSRNCTEKGWGSVYPDIRSACYSEITDQPKQVSSGPTPTHSVNTLLHVFVCRRLHCTRNYIHVNLFVSFMLRAVAVLAKDTLLFSEDEATDCSTQPSLVGCKATLVFFNYFVMANFFWLLVEGLYLHTLLLVIQTYSTRLSIYMFIGWGKLWSRTTVAAFAHSFKRGIPVFLYKINFILFISIIRVLVQKLRCSEVGGNDQSQYRRLAKSTLLLIPLFGVHYVVFFYLMEPDDQVLKQIKIFFDLGIGSFQVGVITSVLFEGVLRLNKQHGLMQSLSKTKLFSFLHKCQRCIIEKKDGSPVKVQIHNVYINMLYEHSCSNPKAPQSIRQQNDF
uniref:Vasoactive intestinal peptide receptor 2 n=1 Tax=Oryzias sinensis TaxID=183150 RepID=A0A8C7X4I8_9TELE